MIGAVLGMALMTAGCGGGSESQEPAQLRPGGAGNGMEPSQAPPGVTPGPVTGKQTRQTEVPPSGAAPNPAPMPDETPVTVPALTPVDLVPGARTRVASWRLAGHQGPRTLLLDVQVGGPPCDAVTGVDVRESGASVRITVHTGMVASARCGAGVPARLGVVRVRAQLKRPLGTRQLLGG